MSDRREASPVAIVLALVVAALVAACAAPGPSSTAAGTPDGADADADGRAYCTQSGGMLVDLRDPKLAAGLRVDGIGACAGVDKIDRVAAGDGPDRDRGPYTRLRLERPVRAARRRIERVDGARGAAHEQSPADERGLRARLRRVRNAEHPLELEARDVACDDAAGISTTTSSVASRASGERRGDGDMVSQQ